MSDGVILLLCLVIIIAFAGIVIFWFYNNNKEYIINDTVKGFYTLAEIGQMCTTGNTGQQSATLLPSFFEIQPCDTGLACVPIQQNSQYGYCKAMINSACSSVYDCAPSEYATTVPNSYENIYCNGGRCTGELVGGLYASCGDTGGQIGLTCGDGLICSAGTCLYVAGQTCVPKMNQCSTGLLCDPNSLICIPPFEPGQPCDFNYCQSGYGCSASGTCQPIIFINGVTGINNDGSTGSMCSIPYYNTPNQLNCNDGLICSFNPATNSAYSYGVTGYGICQAPTLEAGNACDSFNGACIPPNVCYSGVTGASFGFCQAPLNSGVQDINYCGAGSSSICAPNFSCNSTTFECDPNINGLCTTLDDTCVSSTCNGNKLGVYNPNDNTWQYIDLPSTEILLPTNKSSVSVYQQMSIDVNGLPLTTTKCIYYPTIMEDTAYFWYAELTAGPTGPYNMGLSGWSQVTINNVTGIGIQGVKFTTGGNVTMLYYTVGDPVFASSANVYEYNMTSSIDFSTPEKGPLTFSPVNIYVLDWDVDDLYNNGFVGLIKITGSSAYYGTLPVTGSANAGTLFDLNDTVNMPTWCRYFVNNNSGSNINNFVVGINGTTNASILSPVLDTISLGEPYTNGVGLFSTHFNNSNTLELYYASDKSFRYVNTNVNSSNVRTVEDNGIEGYTPAYDNSLETPPIPVYPSNYVKTLSMGNIDGNMFALITICQ